MKDLEEIIGRSRRREISYPELVRLLVEAGVQTYHVDVATHTIFYRDATESYTEHGPVAASSQLLAPFSVEGVKAAIAANQQGKSDFLEFLRQIWQSGVTTYEVDLAARSIAYRGAGGESYVEAIPLP
jgi:uncharacterized protein YbcV (DUF1398 family)